MKFFTNQDEKSSLERQLQIIIKRKKIKYLDFLVGYFRITGFDKIANLIDEKKMPLMNTNYE